jgi:hypothetical protein
MGARHFQVVSKRESHFETRKFRSFLVTAWVSARPRLSSGFFMLLSFDVFVVVLFSRQARALSASAFEDAFPAFCVYAFLRFLHALCFAGAKNSFQRRFLSP